MDCKLVSPEGVEADFSELFPTMEHTIKLSHMEKFKILLMVQEIEPEIQKKELEIDAMLQEILPVQVPNLVVGEKAELLQTLRTAEARKQAEPEFDAALREIFPVRVPNLDYHEKAEIRRTLRTAEARKQDEAKVDAQLRELYPDPLPCQSYAGKCTFLSVFKAVQERERTEANGPRVGGKRKRDPEARHSKRAKKEPKEPITKPEGYTVAGLRPGLEPEQPVRRPKRAKREHKELPIKPVGFIISGMKAGMETVQNVRRSRRLGDKHVKSSAAADRKARKEASRSKKESKSRHAALPEMLSEVRCGGVLEESAAERDSQMRAWR